VECGDLASGTSGACNGGIAMQTKGSGIKLKVALESREIYQSLSEALGEDLEYEIEGSMIIAETEEEVDYIHSLAEKQRMIGLNMELLSRKEIQERQPALSDCVLASTFCSIDGTINPLKVTFGFARAARKEGANIHTYTEVQGIRVHRGRVSAVITDRGNIRTEMVVNAGGIWAPEIGNMVGAEIPIRPRRGMLLVTEAIPPIIRGSLNSAKYLMSKYSEGTSGKSGKGISGGFGLRTAKNGNLLIGSSREFVGYDNNTTFEGISFIGREAARLLPILRHVSLIRTFAGLRPSTPDGLPILGGVPEVQGFIMAAGHEGDGIALAPITGKLIADLIAKGEYPEELAQLNIQRFKQ
jgi:sarcosine oxidase subunit beta